MEKALIIMAAKKFKVVMVEQIEHTIVIMAENPEDAKAQALEVWDRVADIDDEYFEMLFESSEPLLLDDDTWTVEDVVDERELSTVS